MKLNHSIINLAIKKAKQSNCNYRISAIGINKRGEVINETTNRHRFPHKGGGLHAEMYLMKYSPQSLRTIIICRVGRSGNILPIHPCKVCSEKAIELGIKIITVEEQEWKLK